MLPFLHLFGLQIPMYGLCIVIGILCSGTISYFFCKKYNKNFYDFIIVATLIIATGFVFAKVLFLLVEFPLKEIPNILFDMLTNPDSNLLASGFVFYGGLFGGILGNYLGTKIAKCKFSEFISFFAFIVPLVHGFGRIGCFCAGCCYGIPYEGIFSVCYKNPVSSVATGIGIFPVQLLEAFLMIAFAIVVIIFLAKGKKISFIFYLIYYSICRFFLEYLRYDSERGYFLWFSTSQWISIFIFVIAILFLLIDSIIIKKEVNNSNINFL